MSNSIQLFPREIREVPAPLGLFLRPGYNHSSDLLEVFAAGPVACNGVVFEASSAGPQQALLNVVRQRKLDAVLDPQSQPLGTLGGFSSRLAQLPWAFERPHSPEDLQGSGGIWFVKKLAEYAIQHGYTAILAPTHFLEHLESPWFAVDLALVSLLRTELDRQGRRDIDIYYSLALPMREFRRSESRKIITRHLQGLPIDGLWPKISLFGSDATGPAFAAYLEAARDLQKLRLPIVAEHVGGLIGLGLLAFNAVGGIEHGITVGERFDAGPWSRARKSGGGNAKRVYIPEIDKFLTQAEAADLFATRGAKARFGCKDMGICPNGISDMLDRPGRHFTMVRMRQVSGLSQIPATLRPSRFVDEEVGARVDYSAFAATLKLSNHDLAERLQENHARLARLKLMFRDLAKQFDHEEPAKIPPSRVSRASSLRPDLTI